MRLAIIGSRNISKFDLTPVIPPGVTTIVSGGAQGVDTIARQYAKVKGIRLVEFFPQYDRYGRAAPIIRNKQIIENADKVLAIWDGKSKGTSFTIDQARKKGIEVIIVKP